MHGIARQLSLVAATFLTLIMNFLSGALPLFGRSNSDVSASLPNAFTPAGLTFAIWGLIFLGLLVFAFYQASPKRRGERYDTLFWPFLLANLLNVAWLLAFQSLNLGLSVVIMAGLLASLIWLYVRLRALDLSSEEALTLGLPISLYLGWIAVASIANVAAWLVSLGYGGGLWGLSASGWSAALLVVASLIGAFLLRVNRDFAVLGVLVWSFVGVYLARPQDTTVLFGLALGLAVLVWGIFGKGTGQGRTRRLTS